MKLVFVILPALIAFVASNTIKVRKTNIAYNYLTKVGLPLAKKLYKAEIKFNHLQSFSKEGKSSKIIEGTWANLGTVPYQAGLIASFIWGRSVCGGSLLNARRVLTAAHCWWDGVNVAHEFTVVLGSNQLFSGGTRLKSSDVVYHTHWNPYIMANDLAMIKLPQAVQFSDFIQPVYLPSGSEIGDTFKGRPAVASGFGFTTDGGPVSPYLKYVMLQIITNSQCGQFHPVTRRPSVICAKGAKDENICSGDSGGPLVIMNNNRPVLVGVTSFGYKWSCRAGIPAGFSRITSFIAWINDQLE